MSKQKLKSLSQHNGEAWSTQINYYFSVPIKNGIKCPECGEELWDTKPNVTLTSMPVQKNIHCDCGYKGYRIA